MNTVMSVVANSDGRSGVNGLLPFEAPSLILWGVRDSFRHIDCRWKKIRNRTLNLSESLTGCESTDEGRIRSRGIPEQAVLFIRSKVAPESEVRIVDRGVTRKGIQDEAGQRVVEEAHPAAEHTVTRYAQGLTGKAKSRRPQQAVNNFQSLFLVGQDRLMVRLIGVVTSRLNWTGQPGEAPVLARGIGIMFSTKG